MVIALLPGKVNGACTALEPGHPGGRGICRGGGPGATAGQGPEVMN